MENLFEVLKQGLQDIIAHQEGKLILRSEFIEIPKHPKEYSPNKIKNIRIKFK